MSRPPVVSTSPSSESELTRLRDAHRDWFLHRLEEAAADAPRGWLLPPMADLLDAEAANVRAAVQWSIDSGHPSAVRFIPLLMPWWFAHGMLREATAVIDAAVAVDAPDHDRLEALAEAGTAFVLQNRNADARRWAEAGAQIARRVADRGGLARCLKTIGWTMFLAGDAGALDVLEEAAANADGLLVAERADTLRALGWAAKNLGDDDRAVTAHDDALDVLRTGGGTDDELAAHLHVHANLLRGVNRLDDAVARYEESLEILDRLGRTMRAAATRADLAAIHAELRNPDAARSLFEAALAADLSADPDARLPILRGAAAFALDEGDLDDARRWVDEGLTTFGAMPEPSPTAVHHAGRLRTVALRLAVESGDRASLPRLVAEVTASAAGTFAHEQHQAVAAALELTGDVRGALRAYDRAIEALAGDDVVWRRVRLPWARAARAAAEGDVTAAIAHADEACSVAREGWPAALGGPLTLLVDLLVAAGDVDRAAEVVASSGAAGRGFAAAVVAAARGDVDAVRAAIADVPDAARPTRRIVLLEVEAEAAATAGDTEAAAALLATADEERGRLNLSPTALDVSRRRRIAPEDHT